MERRLIEIAKEFERLTHEYPGLSDAERKKVISQAIDLTREMTLLLNERQLRRQFAALLSSDP